MTVSSNYLGGQMRALMARGGRPARFVVAGLINTAFGLTIYPLLLWTIAPLREHYLVGLAIAQLSSVCFAFAVYKFGVFRTRANVMREMGTFSTFYIVNYTVNWVALPLLVEAATLTPVIAQLFFSTVLMITSYFWHSRLTFRPNGNRDA